MKIRKIKEIILFDVSKSIHNKWFIILNIIMFISILILTNISNISKYMKENNITFIQSKDVKIQVVDNENIFYDNFALKYQNKEDFKIEKIENNTYSKENIPDDNIILVEVHKDERNIINSKIVTKEGINEGLYDLIYSALKETRSNVFAEENSIEIEKLNLLNDELAIERERLGVDAENADTKEIVKTISVAIIYLVLIFILSRIANSVTQEKVSKSIEYVLTCISEKEYLLIKVIGSTLQVVIQMVYAIVYYFIGNFISSLFSENIQMNLSSIGTIDTGMVGYIVAMAFYVIFTVFLTSLIQAALSSRTTSVAEAGNTTAILLLPIIFLYTISLAVISPYNAVSPFMYIISCLPIISTFFVPSMIIIGQATGLQIVISFILLILCVPLVFNICAKYFKNGILDYTSNKKSIFKNNKKELSIKEKQEKEFKKNKAKNFAFIMGLSMILLIVLEIIFSLIVQMYLPSILKNVPESTLLVIENSIVLICTLGITTAFIKFNNRYKNVDGKFNFKQGIKIISVGVAFLTILQILLVIIYSKIGQENNLLETMNLVPNEGLFYKIIYILGIALVPAIFEELLFRKAILNYAKIYGNAFAILFSAILFAVYHMNFNQAIFALLIGILFGIIAVRTNSIKLTCILHFLNNGYACLGGILEEGIILNIINYIILGISLIGIILVIKNIPKFKKCSIKINKEYIFIFTNYTFIIAIILIMSMFAVNEHTIGLV